MSLTHTAATRSLIADTVTALLDAGTPPGHLIMATSGDVEVATLTFANPAFGDAVAGVCTAGTIAADTDATGGTIAKCILKNAAGTEILRGTVTATGGGGDIELNSVVISAGQAVSLTALTYTAPA